MKFVTEEEEEKAELMDCGYRRSEYQMFFAGSWMYLADDKPGRPQVTNGEQKTVQKEKRK